MSGRLFYLTLKLGAFGTDLSLLANFFQSPWTTPIDSLSPAYQSWLICSAAAALRAQGRLAHAVGPLQLGARDEVNREDWRNAAISYGNLSGLQLALGNLKGAIAAARLAVDLAERSGDAFQRMSKHTTLAGALHRPGTLGESARLFERAGRLQTKDQPEYPVLHSLPGYWYCDLLLSQGRGDEVLRRASKIIPLALLARGTQHDLDEVFRIATRSGRRLHLTGYHLAMARLHHSREHFVKAEALIAETGYHRRDAELEALRQSL